MTLSTLVTLVLTVLMTSTHSPARMMKPAFFYVGAYGGARGIYGVSLNLATGALSKPTLMADAPGPQFLDFDGPRGRLFAIAEGPGGAASGYAISPDTRALTLINTAAAGGAGTTYITVSDDGRAVLTANYSAGTVSLLPVDANGKLTAATVIDKHTGSGPNASRQTSPHPHAVQLDPTGKYALACDLGNDKIYIYALNSAAGQLTLKSIFAMPPGSGPRHLTFSGGGHFAYIISELTSQLTVLKWDATTAKLTSLQTLNLLPAGYNAAHRACEVVVHPSGKFLYAVDRGPDLISLFTITATTGKLTPVSTTPTGGTEARHFAIDPSGRFLILANMNSDKLVSFRIDGVTGGLTKVGEAMMTKPACILFVP